MVDWKICENCNKKVNVVAKSCPYCKSKSFRKFDVKKAEFFNEKEKDDLQKDSQFEEYINKIKVETDKLSQEFSKKSNELIYENLPEEYADKLIESAKNFSNSSQKFLDENDYLNSFKASASGFSDSSKKKGENFINDRISQESQEKIKQSAENFTQSSRKFFKDSSNVLGNIHEHRKNKRKEKQELKRQEKEAKKRQKEEEKRRKEQEREKERKKREAERERQRKQQEKREKENHERGISYFKKGVEYFDEGNISKCHTSFESSFELLKPTSPEYSASKIYYATTFLMMTNGCLAKNPAIVFTVLDEALTQITEGVKSYKRNNNYCFKALKLFKEELFIPIELNYFNLDFSTEFGQRVAGGWILITKECQKVNDDYRYEKFKGDLFGRTGHHDMAVLCFDDALKSPSCDFRVLGYKAQSLKAMGRVHEANNCFSQLVMKLDLELNKDPQNIYLLREKAVTLASMGLKDRALMIYDEILEINPDADFIDQDIRNLRYL